MRKSPLRLFAAMAAMSIVVAACGSSGSSKPASSGQNTTPAQNQTLKQGGTLTVGAEQEPDCMDWIGSCAGSSWGSWTAENATMPLVYRTVPANDGTPGDLKAVPNLNVLTGAPTLETTPVQKLTYHINPAAVWSDGVPISCDDFVYTTDQQQNGTDLYDQTGYVDIDKVTCPDPKTAVVTYKSGKTYANWVALYAGTVGLLPSHILKGKDRDAMMKDGYSWSGGPWLMKWNKGDSIVLTRNPKWWGDKPVLDSVIYKFITDTAAEFQAFKSGQVSAIYPQPQIDVVDQIASGGLTDTNSVYNANTASLEALWINNSKFPFDTKEVRQAVAYAIDRDAIVNKLFGKIGVTKASQSLNEYVVKDYADMQAFSKYHLDLGMVNQIMTGAGWAKGSDGIWAKGGKRAAFVMSTTTGNKRRELSEQVLQQQLKAAGFDMTIQNLKAGDLFGEALPKGNYSFSLYAQNLTSLTPGLCTIMCSKNIPSNANQFSGQNWTRTNVPAADPLLESVDNNLNDSQRMADGKQADDLLADDVASLPLDPLPDILLWHKNIGGPISDNGVESMFWNIDKWGFVQS